MLILQKQIKNTRGKTYKNIQPTEKYENISEKTTKGPLLDPRNFRPQQPLQKQSQTGWWKTKSDDQQQSQKTKNNSSNIYYTVDIFTI